MKTVKIISTGMAVPQKEIENKYFDEYFKQDCSSWLEEVAGIKKRHVLSDDESVADIAEKAVLDILSNAGLSAKDIDLFIVATDTPEYITPPTSLVLHGRIGMKKDICVFDLNASCASFTTALDIASKSLLSPFNDGWKYALVLGIYGMTKHMDWDDLKTCTLFADGAAGVILELTESDQPGYLSSVSIADGSYHGYLGVYGGGTKYPCSEELIKSGLHKLRILQRYPPDINTSNWPVLVKKLLSKINKDVKDIGQIYFTQINLSSIKIVMEALNLPMEKTHWVMDKYGYTGSACIPMVLHDAYKKGKLKKGDLLILVASGAGYAMCAVAFNWLI